MIAPCSVKAHGGTVENRRREEVVTICDHLRQLVPSHLEAKVFRKAPDVPPDRLIQNLHWNSVGLRKGRIQNDLPASNDECPGVMQGKPVIRGTRITVDLVVRKFSEGATEADVMDAYPHLTREAIRAALAYDATRANAIKLLEGLGKR